MWWSNECIMLGYMYAHKPHTHYFYTHSRQPRYSITSYILGLTLTYRASGHATAMLKSASSRAAGFTKLIYNHVSFANTQRKGNNISLRNS